MELEPAACSTSRDMPLYSKVLLGGISLLNTSAMALWASPSEYPLAAVTKQVMLWYRLKCSMLDEPTISFSVTNSARGAILPPRTLTKMLWSEVGSSRYSGEALAIMR